MMDWSHAFSPPQPLKRFLDELGVLPDQWLYIPLGTTRFEANTPCRARIVDVTELSPEEQDELDAYPEAIGLQCFLSLTQLEEVLTNLRQQHPAYSENDLLIAVHYYWRHDAFIVVHGAA